MKEINFYRKYFFWVILLSIIPVLSVFVNPWMLHTHDGPVHIARMAAWYQALEAGQIPPRWASGFNFGYGSPVLIFMYPLPYFLSYLFLKIGASLVFSFKIVLISSFIASGVLSFIAARKLYKDEQKAFLFFIFYQFFTFRFVEMMVRGSFGETWVYAFVPLVLLGIAKIKNNLFSGFLTISLGVALLILSHNSVSVCFVAVLGLFSLIYLNFSREFFINLSGFIIGLAISAFYWVPALMERKYTYGDLFMKDLYLEHFPKISQLLLPNFNNAISGQVGGIAVQFGILQIISLVLVIYLLFKFKVSKLIHCHSGLDPESIQKKLIPIDSRFRGSDSERINFNAEANLMKRIWLTGLVIIVGCIFLMQPISIFLWQKFALLRQFQFSWRLLSVVGFIFSFTALSFLNFKFFKKRIVFLILVILIVTSTIFYWQPLLGFDQIDQNYFWNYPLSSTYYGEANTIWAGDPPSSYPESRVELVDGKGETSDFKFSSVSHTFNVKAAQSVEILDRTLYFPGWRAYIDGQETTVEFQNQAYRGYITFNVPSGFHQIEVKYTKSKDRLLSEILSLTSFTSLIVLTIFVLQKRKKLAVRSRK